MTKTIQVKNTTVHLYGEGSTTMLMIHGWPDTHEIWDKQVAYFQKEYTCATFTLPGFSKGDDHKYTLDEIVQRIRDIVEAIGKNEQVVFMVHDWGCVFGYEYVMRYPETVKKMVAIDVGDASSKEFDKSLPLSAKLMAFSYQFTLALGWLVKSDAVHKTMAKALKARSNMNNIHAGMGLPYAMRWLNIAGGMSKLVQIRPSFPFFYVYAKKKPFSFHSESWLEELAKHPENRVKGYDSAHWVMVDKAEEFNKDVDRWLKE